MKVLGVREAENLNIQSSGVTVLASGGPNGFQVLGWTGRLAARVSFRKCSQFLSEHLLSTLFQQDERRVLAKKG